MFTSSVVIVGGGASGALTAIHLLRLARASRTSVTVTLLDEHGRHGLGQAYSTSDPHHLLNTRADRMSALDGEPRHLLDWARGEGLDIGPAGFLARGLYGRYLRDTLAAAQEPPVRVLRRVTAKAVGLDGEHAVRLADGRSVEADAVVLALGNRSPAPMPGVGAHPRYVADPWAADALDRIGDGAPVLVLGTGLTMVDVALTVTRAHPGTVVHALSRRALLPRRHLAEPAAPVAVAVPGGPVRVADLLAVARRAVRRGGGDWQGVVEGLRPQARALWQAMDLDERRVFLRRVARYWEIHRHRVPPASADAIAELRATGRLRLLRGGLIEAAPAGDGLRIRADLDGAATDLNVGWLVNATGPGADVTADPFLARLIGAGTARPDPFRLGLDASPDGAVLDAAGRPGERLFALGPLLRGTLYETTAVPEIRAQAAALAPHLLRAATSRAVA
ncbi:FAD/NAD(P)-binding protein [Spongiactinospora sp. TRM90649]|uniref:FAD/NAD(P)-binding protein n=1 Tax=Spongiactinospora sp. TRM90649 TaxID=3031114 RepID=UPI0023F64EF7|nr:FAD/NAD(P)-binding protein [Spongiactinospora sp. TRM90649]MDF5758001.1 FAD/NAD(P)-binding protein [Spongiactinospora sp. TRM90649]